MHVEENEAKKGVTSLPRKNFIINTQEELYEFC